MIGTSISNLLASSETRHVEDHCCIQTVQDSHSAPLLASFSLARYLTVNNGQSVDKEQFLDHLRPMLDPISLIILDECSTGEDHGGILGDFCCLADSRCWTFECWCFTDVQTVSLQQRSQPFRSTITTTSKICCHSDGSLVMNLSTGIA